MAETITFSTLSFALLGGILPPLLWLWFWLQEDKRPEPKGVLILTFLGGMLMVIFAIPAEHGVYLLEEKFGMGGTELGMVILLLSWAFIEEILKYLAARFTALKRVCCDEPVDALIYLITAALGFAAIENVLFLLKAFDIGTIPGLLAGNLRFLGANLLHTTSSAIVGASIGFAFFKPKKLKRNIFIGVILATVLHFFFNYFILKIGAGSGSETLKVFLPLWIMAIVIIFIFEKVKRIKN